MIEQKIDALIKALEENTAAILASREAGGEQDTPENKPKPKPKTKPKPQPEPEPEPESEEAESTYSLDDLQNKLSELAAAKGGKAVKELLKQYGFDKFSDITDDTIDAIYEDADSNLPES